VDSGGTRGLQRIEEVSDNPTHSGSPGTLQKLVDIHICYKQCGQYSYRRRAGGGGKGESDTNCKIQYPVYFVSKVLSDSKTRYFHITKLAYTLLITSRKFFTGGRTSLQHDAV
jgi:hypothetical protein